MPRGRPQASWLRQVESYLKNMCMICPASAWAKAWQRPKEYRRKVDAATRFSGECPHTSVPLSSILISLYKRLWKTPVEDNNISSRTCEIYKQDIWSLGNHSGVWFAGPQFYSWNPIPTVTLLIPEFESEAASDDLRFKSYDLQFGSELRALLALCTLAQKIQFFKFNSESLNCDTFTFIIILLKIWRL